MDFYFTSVTDNQMIKYLHDNNAYCVLLSYLEKKKIISTLENEILPTKIFIDSGAYSAFTRGIKIDIDEYISFLNKYHSSFDLYASLDVIPNSDSYNDIKYSVKKSWENYLYMRERVEDSEKLIYTFHLGEPFSQLEEALMYSDEKGKITHFALGGLVSYKGDSELRSKFIEDCYKTIHRLNRDDIYIHLFGMTDMGVCRQWGASSIDSTTWIRAASFGEVCTDYGRIVVSENRECDNSHISNLPPPARKDLEKIISDYGFTLEELSRDSKMRSLFNIKYFYETSKRIDKINFNIEIETKVDLW